MKLYLMLSALSLVGLTSARAYSEFRTRDAGLYTRESENSRYPRSLDDDESATYPSLERRKGGLFGAVGGLFKGGKGAKSAGGKIGSILGKTISKSAKKGLASGLKAGKSKGKSKSGGAGLGKSLAKGIGAGVGAGVPIAGAMSEAHAANRGSGGGGGLPDYSGGAMSGGYAAYPGGYGAGGGGGGSEY